MGGRTKGEARVPGLLTVSILSLFLLQQLTYIVTPALADLGIYYGNAELSPYIGTISNIGSLVATMITAAVAGKRVRCKTLAIASAALSFATGVVPYFLGTNIAAVLACRFVFGVSFGLSLTVSNMFILGFFEGSAQHRLLGISVTVANVSGVLYQVIGGAVCAADVRATWLVHAVALIPLLFAFMLKEPPASKDDSTIARGTAPEKEMPAAGKAAQRGLPLAFLVPVIGNAIVFLAYYPVMIDMSAIILGEGLGDAGVAGVVTAMYSVGGILAGVLYPIVQRICGRYTIAVCWLIMAVAVACGAFGKNAVFLGACMLVGGTGHFMVTPALIASVPELVPERGQAAATSSVWASMSLSGFLAAPWLNVLALVDTATRFPLYVGLAVIGAMTALWFIRSARMARRQG